MWNISNTSPNLDDIVSALPNGDGTINNPYLLQSLGNLIWMAENEDSWDKYFTQTRNIDAKKTKDMNEGRG